MIGANAPLASTEELSRHLNDGYGLRNLKSEWISRQRASPRGALIRSICNHDIHEISQGSLPWRPQDAHSVRLGVKVFVQIEEVVNVAAPDRKASTPRLLQFMLTDGAVNFIAIELDSAKSSFTTDTVPGTKLVLLPSTLVRRGRIIFDSADCLLLGSPRRSIRTSRTGEAVPGSAQVAGSLEPMGSNIRSFPGAGSANPSVTNITDVGGIADISERGDEDAENEGLWSENPTTRPLYPTRVRERIPTLSVMGINEGRARAGSVQRSSSSAQEPSNTKALAGRNDRSELTNARAASATARSRFADVQHNVSSVREAVEERRIERAIHDHVERQLNFMEPAQLATEIPRSSEPVVQGMKLEGQEPAHGLEGMTIIDPKSPRFVYLSHLMNGSASLAIKPSVCRFYAMKTGKRMEYQLRKEGVTSTVVDDGTAAKMVSLSKEFANDLRNGFAARNEVSQGTDHALRGSLRSICGFVRMECQNNAIVASSFLSEASVLVSLKTISNHELHLIYEVELDLNPDCFN